MGEYSGVFYSAEEILSRSVLSALVLIDLYALFLR
jgi:hypothetical protein